MQVLKAAKSTQGKDLAGNPPPRAARLKTLADCRRAGATTFNLLLRNEITESEARVRGYLLQILSSLITQSDIEARLKILEEKEAKK
jgi:hypothetical protein